MRAGVRSEVTATFGAIPAIRLILQPIRLTAAPCRRTTSPHISCSASSAAWTPGRFVPDKAAFREIVNDLKALKTDSEAAGTATAGPLRVHPGLQARAPGFADRVKAFITRRVSEPRLMAVAFMGLAPRPEPWVFYAMGEASGRHVCPNQPSGVLGRRRTAVDVARRDAGHARSVETNLPSGKGVSTSVLFPDDAGREQARYAGLRRRGAAAASRHSGHHREPGAGALPEHRLRELSQRERATIDL